MLRKKSWSSSPEIRASPNEISIAKIRSNIDFVSLKSKLNGNIFKNSQSFIDTITKREISNNSIDSKSAKLKYTTIGVLNEDNFKSLLTRNLQNQNLEEKSTENILKESMNTKKKPIIGITWTVALNPNILEKTFSQKYSSVKKQTSKNAYKKKELLNNSSTRKQPRQILLSGKQHKTDWAVDLISQQQN